MNDQNFVITELFNEFSTTGNKRDTKSQLDNKVSVGYAIDVNNTESALVVILIYKRESDIGLSDNANVIIVQQNQFHRDDDDDDKTRILRTSGYTYGQ